MPGRAGIPRKVCKTGEAPRPRGGQDAIRGKLLGGSAVFPPEVPRHGDGSSHPSAKRVARLGGAAGGCAPSAALRAARGRGNKPIFAFLHWEYPLPELSVTRLARGTFFGLSPHKHRAPRPRKLSFPDSRGCYPNNFCGTFLARRAQSFSRLPSRARFRENPVLPRPRAENKRFRLHKPRAPAIKDIQFPLHKPSVSTYPLLLSMAFSQTLPMHEGTVFSRHDIHSRLGRAEVFPVGAASLRQQILRRACEAEPSSGRTFSVFVHENCFHFVGESRPCGAK